MQLNNVLGGRDPQKVAQQFLAEFPEVNSVGFGFPTVDGKIREDLGVHIIVGVTAKVRVGGGGQFQGNPIPKEWQGIPTDVISSKPAHTPPAPQNAAPDGSVFGLNNLSYDFLAPGMSVGQHGEYGAGTLGMIVWDKHDGFPHFITNNHVIPGPIGTLVTQPAKGEVTNPKTVGTKVHGTTNGIDAALIRIEDEWPHHNIPLGTSTPINGWSQPDLGKVVRKVGRTTSLTEGKIVSVDMIQMRYSPTKVEYIWAAKIVPLIDGNPEDIEISEPGDSGSIWFDSDMKAVALHFAGDSSTQREHERAFGCPVENILMIFGVTATSPIEASGVNEIYLRQVCDDVVTKSRAIAKAAQSLEEQATAVLAQLNE
jgi:endonuclease G